jgi:hypothetical protein
VQAGEPLDQGEDVALANRYGHSAGFGRHRWQPGAEGRLLGRHTVHGQERQTSHFHQSILAGKSQRAANTLLLRETTDLMIERVVEAYPATDFNRQAPGLREVGSRSSADTRS